MLERLVDSNGVIASSLDDCNAGHYYYDESAIEALTLGLFNPKENVALSTLAALRSKLTVAPGRGIFRNDDGGDYDKQEWVMLDLRLSQALKMAGLDGDDLWQWVTAQSTENANLVAEAVCGRRCIVRRQHAARRLWRGGVAARGPQPL